MVPLLRKVSPPAKLFTLPPLWLMEVAALIITPSPRIAPVSVAVVPVVSVSRPVASARATDIAPAPPWMVMAPVLPTSVTPAIALVLWSSVTMPERVLLLPAMVRPPVVMVPVPDCVMVPSLSSDRLPPPAFTLPLVWLMEVVAVMVMFAPAMAPVSVVAPAPALMLSAAAERASLMVARVFPP